MEIKINSKWYCHSYCMGVFEHGGQQLRRDINPNPTKLFEVLEVTKYVVRIREVEDSINLQWSAPVIITKETFLLQFTAAAIHKNGNLVNESHRLRNNRNSFNRVLFETRRKEKER